MHHDSKKIINRLAKIEGHVKSIKKMVADEEPCKKIVMQLLAVRNAIVSTSKVVLTDHIQHCGKENPEAIDETLDELQEILLKYLK